MGSITPKQTIYLLDVIAPEAVAYCQQHFHTILPTDPESDEWREKATAILVRERQITAEDIKNAPNLRVIGKQGVGIDIIDQDACAARGIPILNTPGANSQSVAELVLALALAVARQLGPIVAKQAVGTDVHKEHCLGMTLTGRTIGIIGMGNIGLKVARMFQSALDMKVYAYDPFAPEDAWKDVVHVRVKDVAELLPHVDVLTLHLPLNEHTRDFISWPQLEAMRPTAILINAARGGIVNEDDLLLALQKGEIWGAGLDCHNTEPPVQKDYEKLWATGRVISTPHIGATTKETQIHTATTAIDRVVTFFAE
ncbi:hypothetical protein NQ176_g2396 [Zarea fungicola]|uniref:Uncharacterized protein n=1 Tax=Zarea fungicola TaxID=93591 RepID=A0ACC1NPK3_9HYPO|nr:hypothetical protein NQ176_g2396 [Lecanicillium fungicola]